MCYVHNDPLCSYLYDCFLKVLNLGILMFGKLTVSYPALFDSVLASVKGGVSLVCHRLLGRSFHGDLTSIQSPQT